MDEAEFTPHVEELAEILGTAVDRERLYHELDNFVNIYKVSLRAAKRGIVKKFGGDPNDLGGSVAKDLISIQEDDANLDLTVRVVYVTEREINVKGEVRTIHTGIFGDPSGTRGFTSWVPFPYQKGDVLRLRNVYTKSFRDNVEINIGDYADIEKGSPDDLPEYRAPATEVTVERIREGMRGITLTARVIELIKKDLDTKNGPRTLYVGTVADASGSLSLSSWEDFSLEVGEAYTFRGGYVKSWRGTLQFTIDDKSEVGPAEVELPTVEVLSKPTAIRLGRIDASGSGQNVQVDGIVLEVRPGSGLIFRCPECRRTTQRNECRLHGQVASVPDLRAKVVVDDGTGALTAILGTEIVETLLGTRVPEAYEDFKRDPSFDPNQDRLTDLMVARSVSVRGNVTKDEYGLQMMAEEIAFPQIDIETRARDLLEAMEAS